MEQFKNTKKVAQIEKNAIRMFVLFRLWQMDKSQQI